jgi:hypothetical protein
MVSMNKLKGICIDYEQRVQIIKICPDIKREIAAFKRVWKMSKKMDLKC